MNSSKIEPISTHDFSHGVTTTRGFIHGILIFIISLQFVSAQTLEDYLTMSEKDNPTLQYHELSYDIAKKRIGEVGNLKDPNFSAGYFVFPPETRVGAQRIKLGIEQTIPWPGTLKAEKKLLKSKSKVSSFDEEIARKKLHNSIKNLYYNLYANVAIAEVYKENKQILMIYEKMALASLENNQSRMSDVLKIRIQKNELHFKKHSNFNDKKVLEYQFNRLLNREEEELINVVDSLNVLDIKLSDQNFEGHPEFSKIAARKQSEIEALNLVDFERKPKFKAGMDYISVSERQNIDVVDNGKDVFMPRVGMSIPIFKAKHDAKKSRIILEAKKTDFEKYNKEQNFRDQLDRVNSELNNAILQVVAAQKNKDQIQRAINSDLKAYETGKLDYDNILKMQLQKIKYQLMEIDGTTKAFINKSMIDYLINP